ncbi:MAG TPA: UDP-N-acetylmuramyl-tripeptide synthetase [Candidatus Jorgensenbacteria bacterium]|nr:UDP-N-acetylmuramyl-tripeptide synthetase [Candidatus Jorgensenbacteria bacterium]
MNMLRSFYHTVLAWTGSIRYRRPSRRLFVVGVTGTKGKSTVIELMNVIFEAAGERTALLSTVRQKIGTETEPNEWSNTMPGRWRLQRFLHRAATERCTYAFVEVTSQGTTQHRHRFIDWDVAVFLNLHPEHIEAHGSFEKYREAKLNFFRSLKHSKKSRQYFLINRDDQDSMLFYEVAKRVRSGEVIWFSKNDVFKMVEGLRATYHQEWLRADFNVENVAAAVALARLRGVNRGTIQRALAEFPGVPGRMEFVQKKPFSVVVDYAHTPESLTAVYRNLRTNYDFTDSSHLICVLGAAGGGRDTWKRPEHGKIAASYGDVVILTSEDPYDEDPRAIIEDMKRGIAESPEKPQKVYEIIDRTEAIKKALSIAREKDIVIITGIGSQKWFYGPNGKKQPWDEVQTVKELLQNINKG